MTVAARLEESATAGRAAESGSARSGDEAALATDSRTVAIWTLVGRLSGFARVAALAAVLGPTFFGNLFQTALFVPYLIGELLAGSLLPAMLAPHLVRCLDRGGGAEASRLLGGVLSVALPAMLAVVLVATAAVPLLLPLLTLAVDDPAIRAEQLRLGWPLLLAVLPQILCSGLAGIGIAVQHAHRRFALATAAPVLENVGVIVVLGLAAALYGVGRDVHEVGLGQVLLLGLGSTTAVAVHAAVQWWGVRRLGIRIAPRAGWRDPEVRRICRMALPSSGLTVLNGSAFLVLLVASGQIPGGAVAFQIAFNFFNLPIALCARPLAAAQLPLLARSFARAALTDFHTTYHGSLRLALFVAIPAGLLFVGIPQVLATAVAFGEMRDPAAIALVGGALAGLGLGILGEVVIVVATSAAYARHDAAAPMWAMAIRVTVTLVGILAARAGDGVASLLEIGLVASAAALAAAIHLHGVQHRALPAVSLGSKTGVLLDLAVGLVAIAPAAVIAHRWFDPTATSGVALLAAALLAAFAVGLYLAIQRARRSTELRCLLDTLGLGASGSSRSSGMTDRAGGRGRSRPLTPEPQRTGAP